MVLCLDTSRCQEYLWSDRLFDINLFATEARGAKNISEIRARTTKIIPFSNWILERCTRDSLTLSSYICREKQELSNGASLNVNAYLVLAREKPKVDPFFVVVGTIDFSTY